jgi:hypothetical protein
VSKRRHRTKARTFDDGRARPASASQLGKPSLPPEVSAREKWWRVPDGIIIVAAASRGELPNPFEVVKYMNARRNRKVWLSETPTTATCRFIPKASKKQIVDQQNEMLRGLLRLVPINSVVWAAYWGDSGDCILIWVEKGTLSSLYDHIGSEIEFKKQASPPVASATTKPNEEHKTRKEIDDVILPSDAEGKADQALLEGKETVTFGTAEKYLGITARQRQKLMKSGALQVLGKGHNRQITTASIQAYLPPKKSELIRTNTK